MNSLRRITTAVGALLIVTVFGTIGYLMLGFTLIEALYQTVTTVATVGFREVRPLTTAGELFTITLIVLGVGTCLYNLTVLLEALTEGDLRDYLERRHMDKRIAAKSGHVIVCGYGRVGRAAVEQLRATGERMVIVAATPPSWSASATCRTSWATSPTTTSCGRRASTGRGRSSRPWRPTRTRSMWCSRRAPFALTW